MWIKGVTGQDRLYGEKVAETCGIKELWGNKTKPYNGVS